MQFKKPLSITFYLYDIGHSPENKILSVGKIRNLCVKSNLLLWQLVTTLISFGIKFCNFQSSHCECWWILCSRTAILTPLQSTVKLPIQLESVLQPRNKNNIQIFIQMFSFNCLVIRLEQKKGCMYASLLENVYIDIENRIPKFKKSQGKEEVKNRGETLSSSSKWRQSAWSFIPQDFQNRVLFIFLPIGREERTSNLCAQVLMKPGFQWFCLPADHWPSGCLLPREQRGLIKWLT